MFIRRKREKWEGEEGGGNRKEKEEWRKEMKEEGGGGGKYTMTIVTQVKSDKKKLNKEYTQRNQV